MNTTSIKPNAVISDVKAICKTNVKSLSGCYGWIGEGTDPAGVMTRGIGYFHFGTRGQLSGSYAGSYGGTQVFKTFTGSVAINEHNYGKMLFTDNEGFEQHYDFVIVGEGKVLYLFDTDPSALQTLTATKV